MIYRVTAKLKSERAAEFFTALTDGTIAEQRPDGGEIVGAMNQAVIGESGNVLWCMGCFCGTPLAHERATVFDKYFDDLVIQPIPSREVFAGASFMAHLGGLAVASTEKANSKPRGN